MFEKFNRKSLSATAAAMLAALGVGGIAMAQSQSPPAQPGSTPAGQQENTGAETSATDRDNVQSGDQNTPDANESGTETESATEAESGTETPGDDGPGGHADEPGNPNAQHEAQGAE